MYAVIATRLGAISAVTISQIPVHPPPKCECSYCTRPTIKQKGNEWKDYEVVKIDAGDWAGKGQGYITPKLYCEFKKMQEAAGKDKVKLRIESGFRSMTRQTSMYDRADCRRLPDDSGPLTCKNFFAEPPGQSEHGNGLALDVFTGCSQCTGGCTRESKVPACPNSPARDWLVRNAAQYHFLKTVRTTWGHVAYIIPTELIQHEKRGSTKMVYDQILRPSEDVLNGEGLLVDVTMMMNQDWTSGTLTPQQATRAGTKNFRCCCHADLQWWQVYQMKQLTCRLIDDETKDANKYDLDRWAYVSGCGAWLGDGWHDWYHVDNDFWSTKNYRGTGSEFDGYNGYGRCVAYRDDRLTQYFINGYGHRYIAEVLARRGT